MGTPRVVVVNGLPGVGKTTVARLVAGAAPNGVCVHGDAVRDFVVTREPGRPRGLTYLAAAALAGVYLAHGFDRVDSCWSAMADHLGGLGTAVDACGPPAAVAAAVEQALTAAPPVPPGRRPRGSTGRRGG